MTARLNAKAPKATAAQSGGPAPMDPTDAMLRGRYAQEPFLSWIAKRIRNFYPK